MNTLARQRTEMEPWQKTRVYYAHYPIDDPQPRKTFIAGHYYKKVM